MIDSSQALRIDAHHHLWRYRAEEFGWIDEPMAGLRRDFLVADLHEAMRSAGVDASIVVQARRTLGETRWLLECAEATESICGVVGWVPLLGDELSLSLDGFSGHRRLVGVREIVQDEADGYMDQTAFDRGIRELTRRGLTFDLLIRDRQIAEAIRLVDRHPLQRFVLDHAAKPPIAGGDLEPWRALVLALARRENVFCKLSGLVTEARWSEWTIETLRPYMDVCMEGFGPRRLMAGSDWPVCLIASTYSRWWNALSEYVSAFSEPERNRILAGAALDFYRPVVPSRTASEVLS